MDDLLKDRQFVGIGRITFDSPKESWNIPNLHFLVSRCKDGVFEAASLEFGIIGSGETSKEATVWLMRLLCSYILKTIKEGTGFAAFRELAKSDFMSEYWCVYRDMEFALAETKDDLSHSQNTEINGVIEETFKKEPLLFEAARVVAPWVKYSEAA